MFSLSRNAIKQTIPSLDIIIMQIQNGHHEITKFIIFALIIGIKTILFYQTICFRYQGMQQKADTLFHIFIMQYSKWPP